MFDVPGVTPSKVKVAIAVLGVNPVPLTVTVIPVGPWEGLRVIAPVVIVNVVEAVSDPPSLPVAVTLWPPAASDGTVNVQENVPVPDVD